MEGTARVNVPVETKTCDYCLTSFGKIMGVSHRRWPDRRFCGDPCRLAYQHKRREQSLQPPEKTCPVCSKTFTPHKDGNRKEPPSSWRRRLTCSLSCAGIRSAGPTFDQEPRRQAEFAATGPLTNSVRSPLHRKRWPGRTCQQCGKLYYNPKRKSGKRAYSKRQWEDRRFCDLSCAGTARMLQLHQLRRQEERNRAEPVSDAAWLIHIMEGRE